MLKLAFNVMWIVFGGGLGAVIWLLSGIIWCCTIIGIPFGIACFRIADYTFWPFGRELINNEDVGENRIFGTGIMNLIWLICFGIWISIIHITCGLICLCTIVGIPFGVQAVKLGVATMTPFGKEIVATNEAAHFGNILLNVLWAVVFGWEIAVSHLVHGLILGITIVGIPFAKQHFKLIPIALAPFGREIN